MRTFGWLLFVLSFCFSVSGCYHTYTGRYAIAEGMLPVGVQPVALADDVGEALDPFGFRRTYVDQQGVVFVHDESEVPTGGVALEGSNANVRVAVWIGEKPGITITDADHRKETEFVEAVKHAIEMRLEERYSIHNLKFKRVCDWLA